MGIYFPSIGGNILHSGCSDERVGQLYCGCWHIAIDVSVATNGHIFRRIRRKACRVRHVPPRITLLQEFKVYM